MTLDRTSLAAHERPTREALARARHAPQKINADPSFLAH